MCKYDCENCGYNRGFEESATSRIAGPCGQQHCWFDLDDDDDNDEEAE